MDELVHHCLRELAFDGDLGSDVSRLKDFIVDFYAHANTSRAQNPDDAFCAFVWSLVVQQPTVMVGLIEPGTSTKVWIAPQTSAKRKALARGEDPIESLPPKLEPIPEPKTMPLDVLQQTYGDRLRIAVEPDSIFAAITGSHIRSSKMSPMVYSALQIITRGRDSGVTVVDLGKLSGYDQKTCFYLVRQLTELDLVMKVRRGGVGTHFCIHKYFFERDSSWKAIRDEETQAENLHIKAQPSEIDFADEDFDIEDPNSLNFTPIDARHLSSLPLISGRVVRLLKASKNHMHASNNMLITLGFSNPTKTDRRFFQSRIRDMIQQGVIEKVIVPNNRKKSLNTSVKCFRLVKHDMPTPANSGLAASDMDDDMDDVLLAPNGIKMNTTIHKQIIDLLEDVGTTGMTLNELSTSLCHFDKRTIELLLARADKFHPPPHLSDLRIASLMETSGRERRHRYFTATNFHKLLVEEQLDNAPPTSSETVDLENVGGFSAISEDQFYETEEDLIKYANTFKDNDDSHVTGKAKIKKNPILADGTVKRGRPRKTESKDTSNASVDDTKPQKGKRKRKEVSDNLESLSTLMDDTISESNAKKARSVPENSTSVPRKRGRPPKVSLAPQESLNTPATTPAPRKRGRPKLNGTLGQDRLAVSTTEIPVNVPTEQEPPTEPPTNPTETDDTIEQSVHQATRTLQASDVGTSLDVPLHTELDPQKDLTAARSSNDHQKPSESIILKSSPDKAVSVSPAKPPIPPVPISPAVSGPSRVNVSHLRRENELIKLLEISGGVFNIQTKEFYEGHLKLLESLSQAGEPTSSPVGTRIDKRTATATIASLEKKGRVKQLKTSITTHTGINRPACIVYLPHVDQGKLNAFLSELAQTPQFPVPQFTQFVKIDERLEYGAHSPSTCRGTLPLQLLQMEHSGENDADRWSKNIDRANQLFAYNESTIREVLLSERTTMVQMYGFIVGKALRCRQFHLAIIHAFETFSPSPHIITHEKRIVDLAFFCQDIPLELYCSLVSPLAYDEELTSFMNTVEGRQTLVSNLPQSLQSTLQLGRSRARSRFLDMLETLRSLELVTPLQPSTSDTPFIACPSQNSSGFDLASTDGWTANTPMIAPQYWQFHTEAPIRLWVVSESRPPFWKTGSVADHANTLAFWEDLRGACNNSKLVNDVSQSLEDSPLAASVSAARSLRRTASWRTEYFFSWHQIQYLKQFIDNTSMSTPLDHPDGQEREAQLNRICWVTSSPREAIENFFSNAKEKLVKTADKIKQKAKRSQKRAEEAKLLLSKKAEEARLQREREWLALLSKVHPEPLSGPVALRLERIRTQFLQSGSVSDLAKWQREIRVAFHEAQLATSKGLKISQKRVPLQRQTVNQSTNLSTAPSEISIQELIELQGPPEQYASVTTKRKRKKDDNAGLEGQKKQPRRHRFQWNPDFDELARDASAIIRARCRNLSRLDWAAFEQVFPSVPRNTVRQRLSHIKETPGNEAYLRRLEDAWYDLWLSVKGTPELPDDDDQSASNFDLIKHIEYLRTRIDKNALRVGLAHATEMASFVLPSNLEQLNADFNISQAEKTAPEWDFMWNALIEEGREKKLKRHVLSRIPERFPGSRVSDPDSVVLAEAALKMAMGTPPERYDPEQASSLLKSRGDELINVATKNLLARGILSKSHRDPSKQKPGRQLKISEINQNAIGGSVTRDTFQDAISLLEEIDVDDNSWHDWPLTATDGDCATLIELVSEDKVDFNIDTSHPQAARVALDWNSKKTDDDQIETAITVRYRLNIEILDTSLEREPPSDAPIADISETDENYDMDTGHELNSEGRPACCRKVTTQGLVDCVVCLNDAWSGMREMLNPDNRAAAELVLNAVHQAGEAGVQKSDILALVESQGPDITMLVNQIAEADIPQIYWTGYESLILVSAHVVAKWSVVVSRDPLINIFPRRWLDIQGVIVPDFWQAALRAVMGLVIFRPGISQAEVRWRLRSVYDRQEVNDVLRYLYRDGYLQQRLGLVSECGVYAGPFDDEEESQVFWFIGEKHWYQV